MTVTKCKIDFGTVVGTIGKEIFGSFVEHFGRCVYTGIYQNDHVLADAFGFRGDVKEAGETIRSFPAALAGRKFCFRL